MLTLKGGVPRWESERQPNYNTCTFSQTKLLIDKCFSKGLFKKVPILLNQLASSECCSALWPWIWQTWDNFWRAVNSDTVCINQGRGKTAECKDKWSISKPTCFLGMTRGYPSWHSCFRNRWNETEWDADLLNLSEFLYRWSTNLLSSLMFSSVERASRTKHLKKHWPRFTNSLCQQKSSCE